MDSLNVLLADGSESYRGLMVGTTETRLTRTVVARAALFGVGVHTAELADQMVVRRHIARHRQPSNDESNRQLREEAVWISSHNTNPVLLTRARAFTDAAEAITAHILSRPEKPVTPEELDSVVMECAGAMVWLAQGEIPHDAGAVLLQSPVAEPVPV